MGSSLADGQAGSPALQRRSQFGIGIPLGGAVLLQRHSIPHRPAKAAAPGRSAISASQRNGRRLGAPAAAAQLAVPASCCEITRHSAVPAAWRGSASCGRACSLLLHTCCLEAVCAVVQPVVELLSVDQLLLQAQMIKSFSSTQQPKL